MMVRRTLLDQIDFRDGRRCAICGMGEPEQRIGRHHITPRREGGIDHIGNLITLCQSHHNEADRGLIERAVFFAIVERRNAKLDWTNARLMHRKKESACRRKKVELDKLGRRGERIAKRMRAARKKQEEKHDDGNMD